MDRDERQGERDKYIKREKVWEKEEWYQVSTHISSSIEKPTHSLTQSPFQQPLLTSHHSQLFVSCLQATLIYFGIELFFITIFFHACAIIGWISIDDVVPKNNN